VEVCDALLEATPSHKPLLRIWVSRQLILILIGLSPFLALPLDQSVQNKLHNRIIDDRGEENVDEDKRNQGWVNILDSYSVNKNSFGPALQLQNLALEFGH